MGRKVLRGRNRDYRRDSLRGIDWVEDEWRREGEVDPYCIHFISYNLVVIHISSIHSLRLFAIRIEK